MRPEAKRDRANRTATKGVRLALIVCGRAGRRDAKKGDTAKKRHVGERAAPTRRCRHAIARSIGQYAAESTRVLAAEYSSTSRKVQIRIRHAPSRFCFLPCAEDRPKHFHMPFFFINFATME